MLSGTATVHVSVPYTVDDRGTYFAARLEGLGVFGYGETEEEAVSDARHMLEFIGETFEEHRSLEDLRSYLDKRRVSYRVEYDEARLVIDREVTFAY